MLSQKLLPLMTVVCLPMMTMDFPATLKTEFALRMIIHHQGASRGLSQQLSLVEQRLFNCYKLTHCHTKSFRNIRSSLLCMDLHAALFLHFIISFLFVLFSRFC